MAPLQPCRLGAMSLENLEKITNGFCEENCIGGFQFGKLYRGATECSKVTVKVYDKVDHYEVRLADNEGRVQDEDCLAHDDYVLSHANMVNFYAISLPNEKPTVIYEIEALDTVHNLLDKASFSWLQRVKVAHGFASIVAHMHDYELVPYIIRNISAAHILLDQEYNAKLYDFSMISGGNLADKRELLNQYLHGCHGYADPDYICNGKWSEKCDVFAYGVVLLSLISKKVVVDKPKKINPEPLLYEWAHTKYQKQSTEQKFEGCTFSLVHKSLAAEALFSMIDGVMLTKLAIQCVDYNPMKRPTMKQVVGRLRKLPIIQNHTDLFGFGNAPAASHFSISGIRKFMTKKFILYSKIERSMQKDLVKKLMGKDNIQVTKKVYHFRAPMILSYEDMKRFTDGFSEENYIDIHQFGKLYHGKVRSQPVTVKTWEDVNKCILYGGDSESRLKDYNPKLFNFGMIEGGILNEKDHYPGRHLRGWMYYTDPYTNCYDYYTEVSDIYSFGMVLLNLIAKKMRWMKKVLMIMNGLTTSMIELYQEAIGV